MKFSCKLSRKPIHWENESKGTMTPRGSWLIFFTTSLSFSFCGLVDRPGWLWKSLRRSKMWTYTRDEHACVFNLGFKLTLYVWIVAIKLSPTVGGVYLKKKRTPTARVVWKSMGMRPALFFRLCTASVAPFFGWNLLTMTQCLTYPLVNVYIWKITIL